jgi:hypothetical protein
MLISLIVAIISQYIHNSRHHIVYLKYTQLSSVNYTSIKLGRKTKRASVATRENYISSSGLERSVTPVPEKGE